MGQQHRVPGRLGHVLQRGAVRVRAGVRRASLRAERAVIHQFGGQSAGGFPARVSVHRNRRAGFRRHTRGAKPGLTGRPTRCSTTSPSSASSGTPASASPTSEPRCARALAVQLQLARPNSQLFIDKPRPFPNYPEVWYVTNGAGHQYNGLTVEATHQFSHGLYFQSSWTWARDRYDLDYNWDFGTIVHLREPVRPPARDRTGAGYPDSPLQHELHLRAAVRQGPALRLQCLAADQPVSRRMGTQRRLQRPDRHVPDPVLDGCRPGRHRLHRGDPADVVLRPDILNNPNLPSGQRKSATVVRHDRVCARRAVGRFGTSGKGVIKGPGVNVWHVGFAQGVHLHRAGTRLRWEMTAINFFNHPNWANPDMNVADGPGSFGVITDASGSTNGSTGDQLGSRSLRMGLRFEW